MKVLEPYKNYLMKSPCHPFTAEIEAEESDIIAIGMTNGQASDMTASSKTAIFVRANEGYRVGTTYVQDLEMSPEAVIKEALANGIIQDPLHLNKGMKIDVEQKMEHSPVEALSQVASDVYQSIKCLSKELTYISVVTTETLKQMAIVNNQGLDLSSSIRRIEVSMSLTIEKPVHRSFQFEKTVNDLQKLSIEDLMGPINEWLELPTRSSELLAHDLPAVLDASVMCNILLTAWQMFSGADYQKRQTPYVNQLNQCVASEVVTLKDLPSSGNCGYNKVFDCEGTLTKDLVIIDQGILKQLMHNQSSARQMDTLSTGHAGRDTNLISDQTEVKIIPSHFVLEAGNATKKDLLDRLEEGIYIYESYDMFHSLNTASGDFAIPCKGIVYKNHEPQGTVSGLTISGNFVDLLKTIEKVANDSSSLSVVMSKSFQVEAPSVYVSNLHVTGGE